MAQVTGEKEKHVMKKKIKYTDDKGEIAGDLTPVFDFLPSPQVLKTKDESSKITLSISKSSLNFFKAEAQKHGGNYQPMIRNLLDAYVSNYKKQSKRKKPASRSTKKRSTTP